MHYLNNATINSKRPSVVVEVHGTALLLDKERPEFRCGIYLSPEQGDRARTRDATRNSEVLWQVVFYLVPNHLHRLR